MNEPANSNVGTLKRPIAVPGVPNDHRPLRTALSAIVAGVVVIALLLILAPFRPSSAFASRSSRPDAAVSNSTPTGLSPSGELLYRFEEFLQQRFGATPVSVVDSSRRNGILEFVACTGGCSPLAIYDPYFDTFARATGSSSLSVSRLSVAALKQAGQNFGNYGVPVVVGGHVIGCSTKPTKFLIVHADAVSFSLGCAQPRNG